MHAKPDLRVFLKWMIAGSGSVITDVITLAAQVMSCSRDARPVWHQARDMLVHRDSSLARCSFWFVTCPPVILANAEMLDMQSVLQQRSDATVGRELI